MAAKKKQAEAPVGKRARFVRQPEPSGPVARLQFLDGRVGRHSLLGEPKVVNDRGVYEVTGDNLAHAQQLVADGLAEILTDGPAAPVVQE